MQNIVLITHEDSERVTHAAVFLCSRYEETALFSGFINRLELSRGEKLTVRRVKMGKEYTLEKSPKFDFNDIAKLPSRMIQRILREVEVYTLVKALSDADEELKDCIFRNMSRRAAAMVQEDMEYMGPVDVSVAALAKQSVLDTYNSVVYMSETDHEFGTTIEAYSKKTNEGGDEQPDSGFVNDDEEKTFPVLVFRGTGETAERVTVLLFDSKKSASQCCEFMNNIKTGNGVFIYARRAEQMVEYEIKKPPLVRFDQIFDYDDRIIGHALAGIGAGTIIAALKGLDKRSREKLLNNLPDWQEEKIMAELEDRKKLSKKYTTFFGRAMETTLARQKIVDAIIAIDRKSKKHKLPGEGEVVCCGPRKIKDLK
jgi:hypothetical protein